MAGQVIYFAYFLIGSLQCDGVKISMIRFFVTSPVLKIFNILQEIGLSMDEKGRK